MALDPITSALDLGKTIIDKVWPDASEADRQKAQLLLTEYTARADIVKAEASSENFLTSSWRPILMLVFGGLIVCRWFGWTAPNLSQDEYLALWNIVQVSLGGYVFTQSAEKIVPQVAQAMKSGKK